MIRLMISVSLLCLIVLGCNVSKEVSKDSSRKQRPNIVLIYADDMGYGEIEALNPERGKIPTPHLNRLSQEGVIFTDAHTTSSVCTPSRYALLTGRYNWRTRLQNGVVTGGGEPLIAKNRLTLPKLLKSQGYSTALIGKWHLEYGYEVPADLKDVPLSPVTNNIFMPAPYPIGTRILEGPITRGFEYFYGFHHSREMSSMVRNDKIAEEIDIIEVLPKLTEASVQLIDQKANEAKAGKPFFLYFALNSPHTPIAPAKDWQGKTALGAYGDFVAQTDGSIGAVLEALDKNGLTENTLVIFSADNGTSRAANMKALNEMGHYPSAQFRGSKADLWDGGHRVPLIVRWSGVSKPSSENNQLICLSDLMATFAELLSVDLPDNTAEDSWSFLPALKNQTISEPRSSVVHHSIHGRFSLRAGDWKLLLSPGSGGWSAPKDIKAMEMGLPEHQLYNLKEDIGEQNNLINTYPDQAKSMIKQLQRLVEEGRSTPGVAQKNDVEIDLFKTNKNTAKSKADK